MVVVRRFDDADTLDLAALLLEMASLYGATVDPDLVVSENLVRQSRQVDIIVAENEGRLLGFATFAHLYPVAGLLGFTYIQQVYVAQAARRLGVAQALMTEVARAAKARGSNRIEWSTGRGNTGARALYDGLGAAGTEKVNYVLEGVAFDQMTGP